jgi:hypothetical protein
MSDVLEDLGPLSRPLDPLPPRSDGGPPDRRCVLPLSSGGDGFLLSGPPPEPLRPGVIATIRATPMPTHLPFRAERLLIARSTVLDWKLHAIRIDGVSQEVQMLHTELGALGCLLKVPDCRRDVELDVSYTGENEGEHFQAAIVGRVLAVVTEQAAG